MATLPPSTFLTVFIIWRWFCIRLPRGCSVLAGLFLFLAVFSDSVPLHEDTSIFLCAIMLLNCIFLTSFVMLILSKLLPRFDTSVLITASLSTSAVWWTTHELFPQAFVSVPNLGDAGILKWNRQTARFCVYDVDEGEKKQWKHRVRSSAVSVPFVTYYLTSLCRIFKNVSSENKSYIITVYMYCLCFKYFKEIHAAAHFAWLNKSI